MSWFTRIFGRIFWHRRDVYRALAEEMHEHIEEKTEQFMRAGLPRDEAEHAARRAFGNATLIEERGREAWQWPTLESIWADMKYALRQLGKSPGFTATAVLTLALGVGVNAAIFTLLQAVLLRPLPYPNADELVRVTQRAPGSSEEIIPQSTYLAWRADNHNFASMAAFEDHRCDGNMVIGSHPLRLDRCVAASADFLSILGAPVALGRGFVSGEDRPGKAGVIVLSDSFWRQQFAADPAVIGRSVSLDGRSYTVIGVLGAGFLHPGSLEPAAFVPIVFQKGFDEELSNDDDVSVIGRLRKDVSPAQAASDLAPISLSVQRLLPGSVAHELSGAVVQAVPLHEAIVGNTGPMVIVLFCATSLVLLIACANVASLLLVRSVNRMKEFAMRRTLGAGRVRLVRQLFTEGILLSCLGGLAGILVAIAVMRLVRVLLPAGLPLAGSIHLSGSLVLAALTISSISGILFSLAPAFLSWRIPLGVSLNAETARVTTGTWGDRLRSLFVASEIALALILLVGAGLLLRSLHRLLAVDPGFEPHHTLTVQVTLTENRYPMDSQRLNFFERLLGEIQAIPGVEYVGGTTDLPFYYGFSRRSDVSLPGVGTEPVPAIPVSAVTPGYFRAMGIPLVAGRFFLPEDRDRSAPVAIVNQQFAEHFLRGARSIGMRLHLQPDHERPPLDFTVVGVVGDTRFSGLDSATVPEVAVPFLEFPRFFLTLAVRTRTDPESLVPAIRQAVREIDKDQPIYHVATMQERVDAVNRPRHFDAWLLGIFAALALGLAAVGLFGVMSYVVANRTREIGIRIALGAKPGDVVLMILGWGVRLALAGVAIGIAVSMALTGSMRSLVFGIAPTDPVTYAAAAAFLAVVAVAACCVPAMRAASVDPMQALRTE